MQGLGLGGPPPAIPEISRGHPARVFDALVARHVPQQMTLAMLCKRSSDKDQAADRLLLLFGKGIAQQLEEERLADIRDRYARRYARMKTIFEEACAHYYEALVANRPIRLIEASPLRQERNRDGYDLKQTIFLSMQDFLEVEKAPFQFAHKHTLEKMEGMVKCLQEIDKEYQDFYAFLVYTCGRRQVHPWNLERAAMIAYEISLFKRELLPGKRAIQVLKEWSQQTDKTKEVGRRLFACFSLIPLVDADIARVISQPRSAQISFDRSDILLSEKEAIDHFILKGILETVFEILMGLKSDPSCSVFLTSYSQLNLTIQTQQRLFRCLEEIGKSYDRHAPPISSSQEYRQQVQLLQTTKRKIDVINIPGNEPAFRFIHAGLLLAHLGGLLPLSVKQKRALFDALYAVDCNRLYATWLMPLFQWPEGKRVQDAFADIEKLDMLTGDKLANYYWHYACDRLNLRPIPHSGMCVWRDEEKGDEEVLRRFLQEFNASYGRLSERIVYYLQDGYYAAPETLTILEKLVDILTDIPPGEGELAERACKGLQIVWKSYPFWQPLIQNADSYQQMIPVLQETHRALEEMYPLHVRSTPSTPSYDFLLSLLLLCHLSQVLALEPKSKAVWFERLRRMTPAGRHTLLQKLLKPRFEWKAAGAEMDLDRFLSRYPDRTEDQSTLLRVQYAFERRNLRSVRQTDDLLLSFSQTVTLVDTLERLVRNFIPLNYVVTLLEKNRVPQKMEVCLNKWEAIVSPILREAPNQIFLPHHLTQAHLECVSEIAGASPIFTTISELLGGILLPLKGWKSYQHFLFPLMQGDPGKFQRQWTSCKLVPLSPLRSLHASMEAAKEGNTLILRFVDNCLNTRTVRAFLPQLPQKWAPLLLELSDLICSEYPADPAKSSNWASKESCATPSTDKLLERICLACPDLRHTIVPFTGSEENRRQLHAILRCLLDLKQGMRQALWQLFKGYPPVVSQLSLKEKRRLAKQENIYRCRAGFSLLPLRDANDLLNPKFAIPFAGKEEKMERIYEKLSRVHRLSKVTIGNALSFEVAQDERDASDESGSSPESCSSNGSSLRNVTSLGVDVHICYCEGRCPKDAAYPYAGEISVAYHEITLFVSHDRTTAVTDKFPIQEHDKQFDLISREDFQERICWLLAMLQSEWYRKEKS